MVGGGLSRALGPMFVADGSKYIRDVIESGSIHDFSQKDHLPKLIKASNPDLILLSLGANHVPHFKEIDLDKEVAPFVAKLIKRVEKIDCIWIAPPIWKPEQQAFNDWLKDKVAPCKFYDATDPKGANLTLSRREDKIHPDEKGGEVWAADFWKWFKEGDGRFFPTPDAGSPSP
jgi:lysophospholipase L1-like esterase